MNYFCPPSAAARYSKGRPFFHLLVIQKIKDILLLKDELPRALDVGCGTGLSTIALKEIARKIVGIDASTAMLKFAAKDFKIHYLISRAESLPFMEDAFDLITMSQVFHWLERDKFLAEARKVLRPGGWLVIYDNYFSGQREDNPEFQKWHEESFLQRYPSPVRARASFTFEEAEREGLKLLHHERVPNIISFTIEELIDYMVSQSNIIAAVEGKGEEIGEVRLWLEQNIRPLYGEKSRVGFIFHAPLWILQRTGKIEA